MLGQYVSILIESSSGPSKKIDPYLKCLKMCCGIPNAYILDKTMYKMHVSFCSYSKIRIPNKTKLCHVRLTHFIFIYNNNLHVPHKGNFWTS